MKPLISLLLLMGYYVVYAQNAPMLSLDSILSTIKRNNAGLRAYDLRAQAFAYQADAATAWRAPMAGLGTFMTPFPGQKKTTPMTEGAVMVQLEQEFPNLSRQKANKTFIASEANIQKQEKEMAYNTLKAQAGFLYYTWIITEKKVHLLRTNDDIFRMMQKITEIRYQYNQADLGAVYKTQTAIRENKDALFMTKNKIAEIKVYLRALMNSKDTSDFRIDTAAVPVFRVHSYDRQALANEKKDIRKMDAMLATLSYNIKAVKTEQKPDGKLSFSYMQPLSPTMPIMYTIMGMVRIPIVPWASKAYKSTEKALRANRLALESEKEENLIKAQGNLMAMQYKIESAQEKINGMEKVILPALKKNLDVNMQAYRENKLELPVIMQAWNAWNMMQINVLNEQLSLYKMIVDYDKELYR